MKTLKMVFCGFGENQHGSYITLMDDRGGTIDYWILPEAIINEKQETVSDLLICKNRSITRISINDHGSFFASRDQEKAFFSRYWQKQVLVTLNEMEKVVCIGEVPQ